MSASRASGVHAWLRQRGIRQVECIFPDIAGYPRGKLMQAPAFATGSELRISQAVVFQTITGAYVDDEALFPEADPDLILKPDAATLRAVAWAREPRALAIHDCVERDGSDCRLSPRAVLKAVLQRYEQRGWRPVVAPEIEFYLAAPQQDPAQVLQPPQLNGTALEIGQSAFSLHAVDDLAAFWRDLRRALDELGVATDTWLHEMGRCQYEINLVHGDALAAADQAFLFKYATRQVAAQHGLAAVFMAKPISGEPGSSMHLHQSVVDAQGQNVFSGEDGNETALFRHYLGGLQRYLPDLMLLYAPYVNSYRRYTRASQAPMDLRIGYDSRLAGLRIPHSTAASRRVENRLAGADANPYLVIAATLACGLAGVDEELSPLNTEDSQRAALPCELGAACRRLAESTHAGRLLGADFVHAYVLAKTLEHDDFLAEVSAWERRYLVAQA